MIEIDESDWWNCWKKKNNNELLKDSEKYLSIISFFHHFIHMISIHDIFILKIELIISWWKKWSLKSFESKFMKSNIFNTCYKTQLWLNES